MKQQFFTVLAGISFAALVSCNNSSETTAANGDTAGQSGTTDNATTNNNTADYSAYATEIETNSASGNYLNPKTGKAYGKLTVNRSTGEITDENNQPVWRYVDRRNWWVYGVDNDWNWIHLGDAKMGSNDQLTYKDDSGNWVTYDKRWTDTDENITQTWKSKGGGAKIKFDKDGDVKYKDDTTKAKYDASSGKTKTDTSNK